MCKHGLRPLIRDPRNLIRLKPAKGTRVNISRPARIALRVCYSIRRSDKPLPDNKLECAMSAQKPQNRREQRAAAQHFISTLEGTVFPNSQRVYLTGSRPDIQVPVREISMSPTLIGGTQQSPEYEPNEAIVVYDTSGPYGDPSLTVNVQDGLKKLRQPWIEERNDTLQLSGNSSSWTLARQEDDGLDDLRFKGVQLPRRAQNGCCVTQLHYARKGIIVSACEA